MDAIRSGKIEIRVYRPKKFHAKAYITHGRLEVVGSAALVGSSNFTRPGLTQNVELNVRFQGPEVTELQEWFEQHWADAEPSRTSSSPSSSTSTRVHAVRGLRQGAAGPDRRTSRPPTRAGRTPESTIYPLLAPYQREAYHGLVEMARQWNGGFLTDGVGLGKTFVGLMLTEYYAVRQRKNVLIMATKTGKDAVWDPELQESCPTSSGTSRTSRSWRTPISAPRRAPNRSSTWPSAPTS